MAMLCTAVSATEITILPSDFTPQTTTGKYSVTKDGITVSVTSGRVNSTEMRVYSFNSITVSSTVGNIQKVEYTCNSGYKASNFITPTDGTFTGEYSTNTDDNVGTWTGDAESITLIAQSQVRLTKIVVTLAGGDAPVETVTAPTIEGDSVFQESTQVTITADEGASIYYTTDGTDPTNASTAYAEPFTISATTTVKAIAYSASGTASEVSEKTFTKEETSASKEIAIVPTDFTATTTTQDYNTTKDGITVAVTKSNVNSTEMRIYANQSITVSSAIGNIQKIEYTCTAANKSKYGPGNFKAPEYGSFSYSEKVATWTGDTTSVTLGTSAQVRVTKIVVTVAEGEAPVVTVAAPTIEGEESFLDSTWVTLTAEEGTNIYYTTDDTDPTTASTLYTEPFELTGTTIVKAVAEKQGTLSTVASKTFSKIHVYSFNELREVTSKMTDVYVKLDSAKVVYVDSLNNYIRQDGKGIIVYGAIEGITPNVYLSGVVNVDWAPYYGIPEAKPNDKTAADIANLTVAPAGEGIDALETTPEAINAQENNADVVLLKNIQITNEGKNYYAVVNDTSKVMLYSKQHTEYKDLAGNGKIYNLIAGVNNIYKGTVEIDPLQLTEIPLDVVAPTIEGEERFLDSTTVTISAEEGTNIYYTIDGTDPTTESTLYAEPIPLKETTTVKAIAEKNGYLSPVTEKTFTKEYVYTFSEIRTVEDKTEGVYVQLNQAKVIYVDSAYNYIRQDGEAIILYGKLDGIAANMVVSGVVNVDWAPFYGIPEAKPNDKTMEYAQNLTIEEGGEGIDALETTIDAINNEENLADVVLLKDVQITNEGKNYYAVAGDSKVMLYSKMHTEYKNFADDGNKYDIIAGVNNIYKGTVEIDPLQITVVSGINTVNVNSTDANAPAYNLAGQRVGNSYKGIVVVNGKKIVKF